MPGPHAHQDGQGAGPDPGLTQLQVLSCRRGHQPHQQHLSVGSHMPVWDLELCFLPCSAFLVGSGKSLTFPRPGCFTCKQSIILSHDPDIRLREGGSSQLTFMFVSESLK